MDTNPDRIVDEFVRGRIARRELVAQLIAIGAAVAAGRALAQDASSEPRQDDEPTFKATGLDHIALRVTDIPRSRDWYVKHLGLTVSREGRTSCFLNCGSDFLALFKGDEAGLDHYSYALAEYSADDAVERLRAAGLEPERHGNRVYFKDPDGLTVQVSRG